MELDELKAAWAALDAKLKKNVQLEESIIREMIKSKTGKLVNRFIVREIISVVVLLLVLPFCVFWQDRHRSAILSYDIFFYFVIVVCSIYPVWGVYKIHGLMKFDFLKDIGNNIFYINRYNIQIKREFKFVWCLLIPVFVILGVLTYAAMNVTYSLWFFMTCMFIIGILITYWTYRKYNKDITSILRSLDEIKELKEE